MTPNTEKELKELAEENGYDSIRIFIAPDKEVSTESVMEDMKEAIKEARTATPKYTLE